MARIDLIEKAALDVQEAFSTLLQWFEQREAGKPTTNNETVLFARCSYAADLLDAALSSPKE